MTRHSQPATRAGRDFADLANQLWWQPNPLAGANAMESATRRVRDAIRAIEQESRINALRDALLSVGILNGNGRDEPSDPALDAAEGRLRRLIEAQSR